MPDHITYLDSAATTPVCPQAAQAAMEVMAEGYGNPSSRYPLGTAAARRLKSDRAAVADTLGCRPEELFFTSCGTEGDNWAIHAALEHGRRWGKHIISTALEHAAVLEPLKALTTQGYEVTLLPPSRDGSVDIAALEAALRPDTVLVSMMLVCNETGVILPVRQAAETLRRKGSQALLHCDAVQGFLKIPFTPKDLGVDLLTISGHKIGAPKGVGALYIKSGLRLEPYLRGGGQENGLRSGTESTTLIAAFAAACAARRETMAEDIVHMSALRQETLSRLAAEIPEIRPVVSGASAPHILALTLPGYKSEVLVRVLGDMGVCVSGGSACHRGKASHVYAALPLSKSEREGTFRVSFSPTTALEDVETLVNALKQAKAMLFPSMS